MKKITAVALLALFLFYQGGYVLLFQYYIHESDAVMNNRISKDMYKDSELVEVKIPVKMPSVNLSEDFENINGQITFKGKSYNYVKLKVSADTLYLKIIPNYETTRLLNAKIIYNKQVSDIPSDKKTGSSMAKKSPSDQEHNYALQYQAKIPVSTIKIAANYILLNILQPALGVPGEPPEMASLPS